MSDFHLSPTYKRIFLEALILTAVAFAIGLSFNYELVMNAFNRKAVVQAKQPAEKVDAGAEVAAQDFPDPIELDEIDEMLAEGAMLVDARNIDDYKAGHLKGAISLSLGEVDSKIDSFKEKIPFDQSLILYCNGFGCPDSFDLGVILLRAGYTDVLVYEGGYPEWRDQGRSLEEGLK